MNPLELQDILRLPGTVFSFQELLMREPAGLSPALLRRRLHYYVQQGYLYPLRRGIYAKDKEYDRREVATRIYTPAYISFQTVLLEAGVVFQFERRICVASYQTRDIEVNGQEYSFRKIKDEILYNGAGVEQRDIYAIATPERAFLDQLYIDPRYYFDNLGALNYQKVMNLLPLYNNKRLEREVRGYFEHFWSDEG